MRLSWTMATGWGLAIWLGVGGGAGCRREPPPAASGAWQVTVLEPTDPAPPPDLVDAARAGAHAAGLAEQPWNVVRAPAAGLAGRLVTLPAAGVEVVLAVSAAGLTAAVASGRPTVFTAVADPAAAGAREVGWLSRWLPWFFPPAGPPVTGASAAVDFDALLAAAGPLLAHPRVAALQVQDDADSLALASQLHAAAAGRAHEAVVVTLAAPGAAADAVARLCSPGLGALVALGARSTDAVLGAIAAGARTCGVPLLGTRLPHAAAGALVTVARDERGAARQAGRRLARLLRDPAAVPPPFAVRSRARLVLNAAAAEHLGIGLPLGLVERADEVLGEEPS